PPGAGPGRVVAQEDVRRREPAAPPAPLAPAPEVDPTAHRHLGFFFHLDVGGGYFYSSAGTGTGVSISGPAAPLGLAVGGAVAENWIVAGELWGSLAPNPKVSYGGSS